jgi:hypothetical protein
LIFYPFGEGLFNLYWLKKGSNVYVFKNFAPLHSPGWQAKQCESECEQELEQELEQEQEWKNNFSP